MFPYDHFWEQVLLDMNLKPSSPALSPLSKQSVVQQAEWIDRNQAKPASPLDGFLGMAGIESFCTLTNFKLVAVQDMDLGLLPKSMLLLSNGDIILATFSARKGYTYKAFSSSPFVRIGKKRTYMPGKGLLDLRNNMIDSKSKRETFNDFGGFCPYYEAMHSYQINFYKFHEHIDRNSFYRFDAKQFHIVRKYFKY